MRASTVLLLVAALPLIGSCATSDQPGLESASPAALPTIPSDHLVGNWGLASYQTEAARVRTEAAARTQCRNPYRITRGPTGGVMMHLADAKEQSELRLKRAPDGKTYLGLEGAISEADREILSSEANVVTMRWLDPDVAGRYGTMIYVRCR